MPLGLIDLSINGIGTTFQALSHRHGPVGPGFQGMLGKLGVHVFFLICLKVFHEMVNEDGWISVLRAENDTR